MNNFQKLSPADQQRLLSNLKRTQLVGLAPTALVVGHVGVLFFIGLESISRNALLGWLGSFAIFFVFSMAWVVIARFRQRKLLNELIDCAGCSSRELLKQARAAKK